MPTTASTIQPASTRITPSRGLTNFGPNVMRLTRDQHRETLVATGIGRRWSPPVVKVAGLSGRRRIRCSPRSKPRPCANQRFRPCQCRNCRSEPDLRTPPAIARRRSTPDESWFEEVRTGLRPGGRWIRTIGTRRIFLASPSIPPIHLRNINRLPRDDRWFESISLQQRVWNEPATAGKAQSCA
jgi:hypothetical protein